MMMSCMHAVIHPLTRLPPHNSENHTNRRSALGKDNNQTLSFYSTQVQTHKTTHNPSNLISYSTHLKYPLLKSQECPTVPSPVSPSKLGPHALPLSARNQQSPDPATRNNVVRILKLVLRTKEREPVLWCWSWDLRRCWVVGTTFTKTVRGNLCLILRLR